MTTPELHHSMETPRPPQRAAHRSWAHRIYIGLAAFFALGIAIQAFLAGASIFVAGSWMTWHTALGHLLSAPLPVPMIPFVLLILSFVGRLSRADKWLCALLLLLTTLQPVLPYLRKILPLLSALHPVNALLMFALPLFLIYRVRRGAYEDKGATSMPRIAMLLPLGLMVVTLTACGDEVNRPSKPTGAPSSAGNTIHMSNTEFLSPSVTISKGQSITLIADTFVPHIISNGTWESHTAKPEREPGAPYVTNLQVAGNASAAIGPFTTDGTFRFYCTIHPGMSLTVSVE